MKKLLSLPAQKSFIIIFSIIAVLIVAANYLVAEAVSVRPVGTISISFAPNGGSAGTEYVKLEYAGPGEADLTDWTLSNSSSTVYTFDQTSVSNTGSVKICHQSSLDTSCFDNWASENAFVDTGDQLIVRDKYGTTVLTIAYSDSTISTLLRSSGDYITEVYAKKDKVTLCHQDNKGNFKQQRANANTIVNGYETDKSGHATHLADIIPSFIHEVNGSFDYYPGNNWPDRTGVYAAGCTGA